MGRIHAERRLAPRVEPLAAWRTLDRKDIDARTAAAVREAVRHRVGVLDRRWVAAVGGCAVAAVGMALDALHARGRGTRGAAAADIVMSALMLHALDGDPAARVVLAHALAALSRRHPDGDALRRRAALWARRPPRRTTARARRR